MTWEIAVTAGFIGTAFILLYIATRVNDDQQSFFPIKMIFITLALLFSISSLRTNSLIIKANNATINNANVTSDLIAISDQAFIVMNWIFYLFILVTILTFLTVAVNWLRNRGKSGIV